MKVIINNNIIKVKISSTKRSIINGMMNKRFDDSFNGMLFFMGKRENQKFWMYNCLIPLDIIFMDGTEITKIHSNCQPCNDSDKCSSYQGFGDNVLEVEGGFCEKYGIKKGDNATFSMI